MDVMEGDTFEKYCGDGITYGIQCKSYSGTVGISAVQQAYAGKDYYNRMVGVVMTNSTYTSPAKELASRLNVILWDGDYIQTLSSRKL